MQKPKSGPAAKTHLFVFLGSPIFVGHFEVMFILILRQQDTSNKSRKSHLNKRPSCYKFQNVENSFFDIFGKDEHRTMVKIRLIKSRKSWI